MNLPLQSLHRLEKCTSKVKDKAVRLHRRPHHNRILPWEGWRNEHLAIQTIRTQLIFDLSHFPEVLLFRIGLIQNVVLLAMKRDTAEAVVTRDDIFAVLQIAAIRAEITKITVIENMRATDLIAQFGLFQYGDVPRVFHVFRFEEIAAILGFHGVKRLDNILTVKKIIAGRIFAIDL